MLADVPPTFAYLVRTEYNSASAPASGFLGWVGNMYYAVGEREGENGLPFVSAQDPRVPVAFGSMRRGSTTDSLFNATKYPDYSSPWMAASGIEAELMRAEVALQANDPNWLSILNTLRSTAITPAMSALTDPGSPAARVDLLYRERAFWLYLNGRRLGDLRRLMRNYQRDPATLFPRGISVNNGGAYGQETAIPFSRIAHQRVNPHITEGCTAQ